jgi:hypothetical protein
VLAEWSRVERTPSVHVGDRMKRATRDEKIVEATAKYVLALERREILREAALIAKDTSSDLQFKMLVAIIQDRLRNGR